MSQATPVEPDLGFIKELKAKGGETLKKCFQCATCSVVCNLAPDENPFPRKEMIWASWGLKDRLSSDPDVWLCHQCNDCSAYCPRGARPGDVLAVLRRMTVQAVSAPRFVARWVNDPKYLPVIFGIPAVILVLYMAVLGTLKIPEGPIVYRHFVPHLIIDTLFPLTAVWSIVCAAIGARRLWEGFERGSGGGRKEYRYSVLEFITLYIIPTVYEILKHGNFIQCKVNRGRFFAHFGILWGFVLLFITTAIVAAGVYLFHAYPHWPISSPIKWIALAGTIALVLGSALAIRNRYALGDEAGRATYFDWLFLWVVFAAGVSGGLTWLLRLVDVPAVAYPMFFVHLVFVWFLFATVPFSKFAHLVYRTTAMVYARYQGRRLQKGKKAALGAPPRLEAAQEPTAGAGEGDQQTAA